MAFLTVDCGNTTLSARFAGAEIFRARHEGGALDVLAEFADRLARIERPRAIALAAVGDRELERELLRLLAPLGAGAPLRRVEPWLENACDAPATTGQDRLFAALGALARLAPEAPPRCLVVDAGTALTVDLVERIADGGPARGRFLGGAIAPGPTLLARTLASGTARLVPIEPRSGVPAIGRDTRAALRSGVVHGFRGAARELAARIAAEADLPRGAVLFLTGGARALLCEPPLFGADFVVHEVDLLVHDGLECAARAACAESP